MVLEEPVKVQEPDLVAPVKVPVPVVLVKVQEQVQEPVLMVLLVLSRESAPVFLDNRVLIPELTE